jgi:uncharacterized membrane protein
MGIIRGERTVEVRAPLEHCYAIAADVERAPSWQESLRDVEVLERDAQGRPQVVETESDAKVKVVRSRLRFSYDEPTRIAWEQVKGDVKALAGWWALEDLGGGLTRATYGLEVDPGRMLGMLIRGPAEARVRDVLLGGAAAGLKQRAEEMG